MPILSSTGKIISRSSFYHGGVTNKKKKKSKKKPVYIPKKTKRKSKKNDRLRNFQLYALKLEGGNYYVGLTAYKYVTRRYDQHVSGKGGAKWTSLHKPIEVIETRQVGFIYESKAQLKENEMTREYMGKYGTEKVRGGDMCQIYLRI